MESRLSRLGHRGGLYGLGNRRGRGSWGGLGRDGAVGAPLSILSKRLDQSLDGVVKIMTFVVGCRLVDKLGFDGQSIWVVSLF